MNINFKDKVFLVTGSTFGIGRQIAKKSYTEDEIKSTAERNPSKRLGTT